MDTENFEYQRERRNHWNRVFEKPLRRSAGAFYHKLIERYYRFLISQGQSILELGCGCGDLLAALKPSFGVGIDFSAATINEAAAKHPELHFIVGDVHELAFQETFDVIVISDLVNDLWDVQAVLTRVQTVCHPRTRIIINFFNNLWRIPLSLARNFKCGRPLLQQNWFAPQDISNLLDLTGYETVRTFSAILLPLPVPFIASVANRFLAHLIPLKWCALTNFVVVRPASGPMGRNPAPSVSVVVPARNEAGNIERILREVPDLGSETEIVFIEGHSQDDTYETIERLIPRFSHRSCRLLKQPGRGKGDAVRCGFNAAQGEVLVILDADLTVPAAVLPRFIEAIASGRGEFINGVRLVYPTADLSMRFVNMVGNKFFSLTFTWLLGQRIKDTLCGTKVLWKKDYARIEKNRDYFGDFDPFGDFDLLFGAAKLNLKITEIPIRYQSRTYGETNIERWRHGWLLFKMCFFAAKRIKFI